MTASVRSLTQVSPLVVDRTQRLSGYLAASGVVLIWSAYFLSLRQGALSPLGLVDLTLFRYALPGLILLPLALRRRGVILGVHPLWLLGMAVGAGLPFFLLGAIGMGWAPVAQGSALIPGTAPLFVTALAVLVFGQPLERRRGCGLGAVLVGVGVLLWVGLEQGAAFGAGQALFLACSLLWAIFTLCVRQSGLGPLEVAAVVTVPNGLLIGLYALFTQGEAGLGAVPVSEWLGQLLVQGIAVGLGSGVLYGYAIRRLGAEITAALGSLTPVCATLLALVLLGEGIDATSAAGLALVTLGVAFASGLLARR